MRRTMALVAVIVALCMAALAATASAQVRVPPTAVAAGPVTVTVTVESLNGDRYHQSSGGDHTCYGTGGDDGGSGSNKDDNECWSRRGELQWRNVDGREGGAATCRIADGTTSNGVTWDGVYTNRWSSDTTTVCGDPTQRQYADRARVYTGVAVAGAADAGVAAGGEWTKGGCVQALGVDDTEGNQVASAVGQAQALAGEAHSPTDDDSDVTLCASYG